MAAAGVWYFGVRHTDGPLGQSGLGNKLCMPVGNSDSVTIGNLRLRNTGSSAAEITDVSIIDPYGVEDAGALLVPDLSQSRANSKPGWAFGNGPFDGENGAPTPAIGTELPANSPADTWLVVQVHRKDVLGEGRLTGIRIEYRSGARRYALELGPEHTLRPGRCF